MTKNEISGGTIHKLPSDFKKELSSDRAAREVWESLTPLARNKWICWTISVKKDETRKEHIKRAKSELKEGKRRPCCWIGCVHRTDKAMSPSVKAILNRRKRRRDGSGHDSVRVAR